MAAPLVTLTLRCSNSSGLTPYVDLVMECVAGKPRIKDEDGSEPKRDVNSYIGNGIAWRREYEFLIKDCTVRENSTDYHDFGSVNRWAKYIRAKFLAIVSVTDSPRGARLPATPTTHSAYWTSGNELTLPHAVRRVSFDFGDGENGSLEPVLVLEDTIATVGVTIS